MHTQSERLSNLNESDISRAPFRTLSPVGRENDTLTISGLDVRRATSTISNVALDLRSCTKLILSIVDGLASSDNKVGADEESGADLPDGVASQFVGETRFDLDNGCKQGVLVV